MLTKVAQKKVTHVIGIDISEKLIGTMMAVVTGFNMIVMVLS